MTGGVPCSVCRPAIVKCDKTWLVFCVTNLQYCRSGWQCVIDISSKGDEHFYALQGAWLALHFKTILVLLVNVCFCCVRFSLFGTKTRDYLERTSPK